MMRRIYLWVEFVVLFICIPCVVAFTPLRDFLLVNLWIVALGCLIYLMRNRQFDRRQLWNAEPLRRSIKADRDSIRRIGGDTGPGDVDSCPGSTIHPHS